ncbi:MAG TPA: TRC40/GET3/ArsA family transport-energizing ATPase [Vicinamibacterales bacterium]|nr:TRC40/GET3/ArsA family transport-energizing ATPase [Vicinamibacterales bacterium]
MFFAGKGGVGKTTCSSAFALSVLGARSARRVLLVSTDPAHSLGDALGVRLSAAPRAVAPNLDAVELNAQRAFARWLVAHRRPLGEIIEHGTWLDRADVDVLLDLSIPGVDELVGILEIARFVRAERKDREDRKASYDLVVVDTAPTGHTLRLLAAPRTVAAVADALDALQEPHRVIRDRLARVGRPEASDRLIALLADQAREAARRLRDPRRTEVQWVTLPEELARAESADGVAALQAAGLRVAGVVVNRVLPDGRPCPLCDRRRAEERRVIAAIRRELGGGRRVSLVAATPREPRGLTALASLGSHAGSRRRAMADGSGLMANRRRPIDHPLHAISHQRSAIDTSPQAISHQPSAIDMSPHAIDTLATASLLFVGGKGGVGKTTVAAAAALRLAESDSSRRVLLLSSDPAHSIGDVLRAAVGDTPHSIAGGPHNLVVRELDAPRALAIRRTRLEAALDEIASAFGAGDATRGGASGLLSLAPPGIDELFGVLSVVDAHRGFDVIVVDMAPTGHALRLLEMADNVREWLRVLLRVLLKYKALVRPGQLAEELVALSRSIRELQALLRNPTRTRFIVVTRAAAVPRAETARLLAQLRRLQLSAPAIVVNALTLDPGRCAWCRTTAAIERRELEALRRLVGRRCVMIQTPLVAPPPRGLKPLKTWARGWLPA